MLPGRTAAKVVARHQYLLLISVIFLQGIIGPFRAVFVKTPTVKTEPAKAFPFRRCQKLSWNDLVGIDIVDLQVEGAGFYNA